MPRGDIGSAAKEALFGHLVGLRKQHGRHPETKHRGGFRPNKRAAETLLVFLDILDKMS
jgi:hypothetical protein